LDIIDAQIHDPQPVRPFDAQYGEDAQLLMSCELAREAMDAVGVDIALINSRQEVCDYFVTRLDRFSSPPRGTSFRCSRWQWAWPMSWRKWPAPTPN
jgi:hypothetical protein